MRPNQNRAKSFLLYSYLASNHFGKENGIKRPELAQKLNISERELRTLTKEINTNPVFEKVVSTTHSCYLCKTKDECVKTIKNTYRVAISLFKKAKQMERRVGLNGQIKIPIGSDYKEIVETFIEE